MFLKHSIFFQMKNQSNCIWVKVVLHFLKLFILLTLILVLHFDLG